MITLLQIESAINYWRAAKPANETDKAVCREVSILADIYAVMIHHHMQAVDPATFTNEQMIAIASWNGDILPRNTPSLNT
jgi:hypothetical protein